MSRLLYPLFAILACCTKQELARQVAYLKAESQLLRQRLPGRIVTTPAERRRLVKAGRRLGKTLRELISIVSYETFRRWVREIEDGGSTRKPPSPKKTPGRPRTSDDIRQLVLRMRQESGFGYTRILGELKKLGITVARQTVKNILKEAGLTDPEGSPGVESWDDFLKRHAATLWQIDFTVKRKWTLAGLIDLSSLASIWEPAGCGSPPARPILTLPG